MSLLPASGVGDFAPVRSAAEYAHDARRRNLLRALAALALALAAGGAFIAFGIDSVLLPFCLLVAVATPILLWSFPRLVLYITFGAVCLLETFPTSYSDALTDRVPFFWNVNTIFQVYANANVKAVPFNLFEIFLITAGVCSLFRAVYGGGVRLRGGPLLAPICAYMAFVLLAWVSGLATGGDFKIALQESRAQVYLLIAYLMGVNLITERRQVNALLWASALCIGIKGALYTFRRYVTIAGQPLPDQGVGSHEEAFFFDVFLTQLVALWLCRTQPKLLRVMLLLAPLVILGNLATNRRAGTAALILIAIPVLLAAGYRFLPERRRAVAAFALALAVLAPPYYQAFRHSDSLLARPARAVRSHFEPDARDAASNAYRDAENLDQMATIRSAPWGYGYGKRMLHVAPIADISNIYDWWDILPHNQILWVWMRTGFGGFFAFWVMIAAVVLQTTAMLHRAGDDRDAVLVGLLTLTVLGMLLIVGLLDLQLSNPRNMLFAGIWIAVAASLPPRKETATPPAPKGGRP